jgi:hypothetical protein
VRVGAQRELDVRVSQKLLHELRFHPLGEEDRGTGMPQVVEADVRQSSLLEERLEAAPVYVGRLERGADLRGEHQPPIPIQRPGLQFRRENAKQFLKEHEEVRERVLYDIYDKLGFNEPVEEVAEEPGVSQVEPGNDGQRLEEPAGQVF